MSVNHISGIFVLRRSLFINASPDIVWDFLSDPSNLGKITPPSMNFLIRFKSDNGTGKVYAGQIICYKVTPLPFIRASWVTEITQVKEGYYFIDEQRFGPYSFWYHQHMIHPSENGTLMEDIISFKIPFGLFGRLFGAWLVKSKLKQIFDFREKVLNEMFPE